MLRSVSRLINTHDGDDDDTSLQGQEVKGQDHSVTQRISNKKRYTSGTERLIEYKRGENYPNATRVTGSRSLGHILKSQ